MKTGITGLIRGTLMCLLFFTGNYSFAQSDSLVNPEIDSSSLTDSPGNYLNESIKSASLSDRGG